MASLLEKYAEKLNKTVEGIESFRAKVLDVFIVAADPNGSWRKVGIKTDKGVFFGFENALNGVSAGTFLPEAGLDAQITIKEQKYTDESGVEKETLSVIKCSVDMVSYRAAQIKGSGLSVNLF